MPLPVTIIIPSWNSGDCIATCLTKAINQDVESIHVVDNGSIDTTLEIIRTQFPSVKLTSWSTNQGFAAAMNFGISESHTEFVFLLNDDCELENDYISILVHELRKENRAASATGKLLSSGADAPTIDSVGICLDRYALRPLDKGHGELDEGQYDLDSNVFGPSAAAVLFRKEALISLGEPPFDESLVSYYEDVDLAWRLNNAKWRHHYCHKAVGFHLRRGPEEKPIEIRARAFANRYIVWAKNESFDSFVLSIFTALPWEIARLTRRYFTCREELSQVPRALNDSLGIVVKRIRNSPQFDKLKELFGGRPQ